MRREKDMILCKNCGRELNSDTGEKCSYCGVSLNDSPFSSSSPAPTSDYNKPYMSGIYQIQRPTGDFYSFCSIYYKRIVLYNRNNIRITGYYPICNGYYIYCNWMGHVER